VMWQQLTWAGSVILLLSTEEKSRAHHQRIRLPWM
jgi:hypothetical protein